MTPLEDFTSERSITQERAERAADWLAHHAAEVGRARRGMEYAAERIKIAEARAMLTSDEKSADMRKAAARASKAYADAVDDAAEATEAFRVMEATVKAAEVLIEVWRSINSATKGIPR